MPSARDRESAFIGTPALSSERNSLATTSLCRRPARRRRRLTAAWRCAAADPSQPDPSHLDTPQPAAPQEQVEGALEPDALGALDAGLEAALSKGWDNLELFGEVEELSAKGAEVEEEVEDEDDGDEEEGDGEKEEGAEGGEVRSEGSEESVEGGDAVDAAGSGDLGAGEDGAADGVQFLKPTAALPSDDAVAATAAAKEKGAGKKKKVTAAGKKKTAAGKKKARKEGSGAGETQMSQREMLNSEEWDAEPRWFFLQVKPGCEQSCAISIRNMAQALALEIREVLVPTMKIMRLTKSGKSVRKEERMFPSYILVLMVMNKQNYADIQRVPNVQWFMGDPNRDKAKNQPYRSPLPVSDAEMRAVFERIKAAESAKPERKTAIRPGDSIEVISGSFEGNMGRVVAVKPDLNLIVARLIMFARETSVELEMNQVKVVKDIMNIREPGPDSESDDTSPDIDAEAENATLENEDTSPKDLPSAGVASAADDLALLLSDTPNDEGTENADNFSLFGGEDDGFTFLDEPEDSSVGGKRGANRAKKSTNEEGHTSLLAAEDDHLSFLDNLEEERGAKSSRSYSRQVEREADQSSDSALIESDDDLESFLSNENDSDLWEPSESVPSVVDTSGDKKESATLTKTSKGEDDSDLFAFLEKDEFEEASILPDSAEEPMAKT